MNQVTGLIFTDGTFTLSLVWNTSGKQLNIKKWKDVGAAPPLLWFNLFVSLLVLQGGGGGGGSLLLVMECIVSPQRRST